MYAVRQWPKCRHKAFVEDKIDAQNEAGDRTTVFNYGEDITFHFDIKNDSTQKFVIPSLGQILEDKGILKRIENGEKLPQDFIKQFDVYTSDGQYVNRACDYVVLTVESYRVSPGDMYQAVFRWQKLFSDKGDVDRFDMFWKEKQRDPLPVGSYYTLHELYHEDGTSMLTGGLSPCEHYVAVFYSLYSTGDKSAGGNKLQAGFGFETKYRVKKNFGVSAGIELANFGVKVDSRIYNKYGPDNTFVFCHTNRFGSWG